MAKPTFDSNEKKTKDEYVTREMLQSEVLKVEKMKEDEIMNKTIKTSSGKSLSVADMFKDGVSDGIECPDGKCKSSGHHHHMKQDGDSFVCEGEDCGFKARLVPEKVIEDLAGGYKCKKCGKAHLVPNSSKLRKEDKCYNCGGEEFER